MARTTSFLSNFTAGELTPLVEGQVNLKQYYSGGREVRNFVPLPHGPLKKRGGTAFVKATKTSTGNHRLIPFQFNTTQAYVIEMGEGYLRFFSERGQVTSDGTAPYELLDTAAHPYTSDEIPEVNYTQSADTLIMVHPNHPPYELLRNGHTDWTCREITWVQEPLDSDGNAYWTAERGYPLCVTFFEQRLIFAGSLKFPQTFWCSVIGVYYDFTVNVEVTDDDAIIYTIATDQVNGIRWMLAQKVVLVGTKGGEFKFSSTSLGETITPSNAKAVRQTNHGSANVRPALVESSALFVQAGSRKVRNITYDVLNETYSAEDITILAEHITKGLIKEATYQNNPDSIYWANLFDGKLLSCTLEQGQKVVAWAEHTIAGDNAVVESIANIEDDAGDELWMIVSRTIDGETVKYVEYLADHLRSSVPEVDRAYTDSYIRNDFETPTQVITGLDHLEGQTVVAVVDNWVDNEMVVTDGSITLSAAGSKVIVGLPYTARYMSMRVQGQMDEAGQLTYHMEKRIVRAWVSVYESLGLAAGVDGSVIEDQQIGGPRVMGVAREYVTQDVEVNVEGATSTDARFVVESRGPLPLNVLGIVFDLEVSSL
jgi:hypothetical protein